MKGRRRPDMSYEHLSKKTVSNNNNHSYHLSISNRLNRHLKRISTMHPIHNPTTCQSIQELKIIQHVLYSKNAKQMTLKKYTSTKEKYVIEYSSKSSYIETFTTKNAKADSID